MLASVDDIVGKPFDYVIVGKSLIITRHFDAHVLV